MSPEKKKKSPEKAKRPKVLRWRDLPDRAGREVVGRPLSAGEPRKGSVTEIKKQDKQERAPSKPRPYYPRRKTIRKPKPAPEERKKTTKVIKISPPKVLFTIGLGRQPLQRLLEVLVDHGVQLVADICVLAGAGTPGFKKGRDLALLLKEVAGIEYRREELLLPSRELLIQFWRDKNWTRFEAAYIDQLDSQQVEEALNKDLYGKLKPCLLGDDMEPEHDYRTVAAEYLRRAWKIDRIKHL